MTSSSRSRVPGQASEEESGVHLVAVMLCDLCLDGAGGECHVPGCALCRNRAPDLPLRDNIVAHLKVEMVDSFTARSSSSPEGGSTA